MSVESDAKHEAYLNRLRLMNANNSSCKKGDSKSAKMDLIRPPFGWPGGKARLVPQLLDIIPYKRGYCEPFGGSAALLLCRQPSSFEVYNDRFGGVAAFWLALKENPQELISFLEDTVFAKEIWQTYKEEWEGETDTVIRAAKWYYVTAYSFGQMGRHWGRVTDCASNGIGGRVIDRIKDFSTMAKRLKKVTIENDDWETILSTYDSPDMVFYLDPPYIQTQVGTYKHNLTMFDHKRLLDKIFTLKGSAYLSGYHHEMIDAYPWDEVHEWDQKSFLAATGTASNAKEERPDKVEVLWVKK